MFRFHLRWLLFCCCGFFSSPGIRLLLHVAFDYKLHVALAAETFTKLHYRQEIDKAITCVACNMENMKLMEKVAPP